MSDTHAERSTESSILGPKGRVVIPQRFREALNLSEGDELVFTMSPAGALTATTAARLVEALAGTWKDGQTSLVEELFADRLADVDR